MNRLEQYIRNNKSLFNEEPAAGHFERLQQKIDCQSKQIIALRRNISIAASIAIVFFAGVVWQHSGKQDNGLTACENADNMKDCYLNRMNTVASRIKLLTVNLDQWDQQQVMTDVQNIIDIAGNGFESEIPEELPAKEAKSILSDYYLQNLKSLEMIAEELGNRNI